LAGRFVSLEATGQDQVEGARRFVGGEFFEATAFHPVPIGSEQLNRGGACRDDHLFGHGENQRRERTLPNDFDHLGCR
jgi:hypothetical protein